MEAKQLARRRIRTLLLAVFALYPAFASPLHGQPSAPPPASDFLLPEDEAPPAFLGLGVGSEEVDLFAEGSWRSELSYALGFARVRDGDEERVVFPSVPSQLQRPLLDNSVNLTLSLWLRDRYFFETELGEDVSLERLIFGYRAPEGEFLRSVTVGNGPISISSYPYFPLSEIDTDLPGVEAAFETAESRHEVLLRLEASESVVRRFRGTNEIIRRRIDAAQPLRRRYFILPDAEISELRVYLADAAGSISGTFPDGVSAGRYREIALSELRSYSLEEGYLFFPEPVSDRLLVFYRVGATAVASAPSVGEGGAFALRNGQPDPEQAIDVFQGGTAFNELLLDVGFPSADRAFVDIGGRRALVVSEPGVFSPFESLARYPLPEDAPLSAEPRLLRRSDLEEASLAVRPRVLAVEGAIELSDEQSGVRAFRDRYPLGPEPGLYRADPANTPDAVEVEIVLETVEPGSEIRLASDAVLSSLEIRRNGNIERGFRIDEQSRVIRFASPPQPSDRIELRYRRFSDAGTTSVLGIIGNRFALTPELTAELALGAMWNPGGGFSRPAEENPGRIALTGSLSYRSEPEGGANASSRGQEAGESEAYLEADGRAQLAFETPDTSGRLLLADLDTQSERVQLAQQRLLPGAIPLEPTVYEPELTTDSRGALIYRDFSRTTPSGALQYLPLSVGLPPERSFAYEEGSRVGPYLAGLQRAEGSARVAVVEYELGAQDDWVSAHIQLPPGVRLDLSAARDIELPLALLGDSEAMIYRLDIGALGEDLDGDGLLDAGPLEFSPPGGPNLLAGGLPPTADRASEDQDADGRLDPEIPASIYRYEFTPDSYDEIAELQLRPLELDPADTDRRRLSDVRGLRVFIRRADLDETTPRSGRLVIGEVRYTQGAWAAEGPLALSFPSEEEVGGTSLAETYPEARVFGVGESGNRFLRLELGGDEARAIRSLPPVRVEDYRILRVYVRNEGASDVNLGFGIGSDGEAGSYVRARGIRLEPSENWRFIELDIDSGVLYLDGEQTDAIVEARLGTALPVFAALTVEGSPGSSILVEAPHLADPRGRFLGRSDVELRAGLTRPLANLGPITLIGYPELSIGIGGEIDSEGEMGTEADIGAELVAAETRLGFRMSSVAEPEESRILSRGHSFRFPARAFPVRIDDSFELSYPVTGSRVSRRTELSAELVPAASSPAPLLPRLSARLAALSEIAEESLQAWLPSLQISGPAGALDLRSNARFEERRGRIAPVADYARAWIDAYAFILPQRGTEFVDRSVQIGAVADGTGLALEPRLEAETSLTQRVGTLDLRLNRTFTLSTDLSPLPIRLSLETDAVLRASVPSEPAVGFRGDLGEGFSLLSSQIYAYRPVLATILSMPQSLEAFDRQSTALSSASYEPVAAATVSRPLGSLPRDLLIPRLLRIEGGPVFRRSEDSLSDSHALSVGLRAVAVNVFGARGTTPVFSFYDSDELSWEFSVEREDRTSLDGSISAELFAGGWDASLRSELRVAETADASPPRWRSQAYSIEAGLNRRKPIPESLSFLTRVSGPGGVLEHRNGIDFRYAAEAVEASRRELTIEHETAIFVGEAGEVSAAVALGWEGLGQSSDSFGIRLMLGGSFNW